MSKFTEDDKIVAKHINKKFKWVARDKSGDLYIYYNKPTKGFSSNEWIMNGAWGYLFGFEDLFKSVTWEDKEPTLIRDIYDPQILDDKEREYLTAVLSPLKKVDYVTLVGQPDGRAFLCGRVFLCASFVDNGKMTFPTFKTGTMYRGMDIGRKYTPDELGLEL